MRIDDVTCIGVIGAGQMGRGICQVLAMAGWHVLLIEVAESQLNQAPARIREGLHRSAEKGDLDPEQVEKAMARIHPSSELDPLKDAQLVIEAVSEDPDVKHNLFSRLGGLCPSSTILASNTSSISISKLGIASGRPEQVVGIHFMNPVPVMRLVEIVQGKDTSKNTVELALNLVRRLGKVPVVCKDVPGFIVNRILIPMINEAVFALESEVATAEDIDQAMTAGTNHPMGPLALADRIGLDTVQAICNVLHQDLGDPKFLPCPLLRQYVEAGWLGKKTGRGFYIYG